MNKNRTIVSRKISALAPTEKTMEAGCPILSFTLLVEWEFWPLCWLSSLFMYSVLLFWVFCLLLSQSHLWFC